MSGAFGSSNSNSSNVRGNRRFLAVIAVQIVVVILILVAVRKSFSWDSSLGNLPDDHNIEVYLLMTLDLFMYSQ